MDIVKIAFFDSGIGGLTVLHQAMRLLPEEDYIFYADTAHVPYGEKSKETVRNYVFEAADFLAHQNLKALVIACNTATSIAADELRDRYTFPILGIEPAVKPAVQESEKKRKKVLVLATRLTLREEKYHNLVQRIDRHEIVDSLALPGLVTFAERFIFDDERVYAYLKTMLDPLPLNDYGTVVLGCTHFPFFKDQLKKFFPADTDIIDGGEGTARNLKRILEAADATGGGHRQFTCYRSGVPVRDDETLRHYRRLLKRLGGLQR